MDDNRILIIGQAGPFRQSEFWNPPNLAEFNAVIWYPLHLGSEERDGHGFAITERLAELFTWIKEGHILVVIGAFPRGYKIGYVQNNRHNIFDPLTSAQIFQGVSFHHKCGALTEYCGPDSLSDALSAFAGSLSYDAVLDGDGLVPLFRVSKPIPGRDQLVGAYKEIGNGIVAFLPPLISPNPRDAQFHLYHLGAASILEALKTPGHNDDLPQWSMGFKTPAEQDASQKISNARGKIQELEEEIFGLTTIISAEQSTKLLFTATGDIFTRAVAVVLREFGLKVIEGPKQRADLLAWDGKRLAAIEVKGLEGPAREKNIGQVRRWTADVSVALSSSVDDVADDSELASYRSKLGELGVPLDRPLDADCKGIVILGTYRKTPLNERPEAFVHPVERVIVRSGVCALTGLSAFFIALGGSRNAIATRANHQRSF